MTTDITWRQLRNDSGQIMRGWDQGETHIVIRNGLPVGEWAPMRRHRLHRAVATTVGIVILPLTAWRRWAAWAGTGRR